MILIFEKLLNLYSTFVVILYRCILLDLPRILTLRLIALLILYLLIFFLWNSFRCGQK